MKTKTMDWTTIILLSLFGIIMGALSVKGFTQKLEPFLWLLFGIITSLVLSKNLDQKTFLHGLLIGLAWGIVNGLTQSAFFDTYLENNSYLQEGFKKTIFIQPRYFVLITGPIIGLITGLVVGGLSLLLKRIW